MARHVVRPDGGRPPAAPGLATAWRETRPDGHAQQRRLQEGDGARQWSPPKAGGSAAVGGETASKTQIYALFKARSQLDSGGGKLLVDGTKVL